MSAGMPAEHALLGLLAMSETASSHGYELARHFGAGAPLGNVIRLEPGMVYHHLKKIERLGWVETLPAQGQGRPVRRPFTITAHGRKELHRWLAEPVARTREIRLEFLVKLYLALALDPTVAIRLIDEQREICARLVESLNKEPRRDDGAEPVPERGADFGEMVLALRLAQTRAALDWLDRVTGDAAAMDTGVES